MQGFNVIAFSIFLEVALSTFRSTTLIPFSFAIAIGF